MLVSEIVIKNENFELLQECILVTGFVRFLPITQSNGKKISFFQPNYSIWQIIQYSIKIKFDRFQEGASCKSSNLKKSRRIQF